MYVLTEFYCNVIEINESVLINTTITNILLLTSAVSC